MHILHLYVPYDYVQYCEDTISVKLHYIYSICCYYDDICCDLCVSRCCLWANCILPTSPTPTSCPLATTSASPGATWGPGASVATSVEVNRIGVMMMILIAMTGMMITDKDDWNDDTDSDDLNDDTDSDDWNDDR